MSTHATPFSSQKLSPYGVPVWPTPEWEKLWEIVSGKSLLSDGPEWKTFSTMAQVVYQASQYAQHPSATPEDLYTFRTLRNLFFTWVTSPLVQKTWHSHTAIEAGLSCHEEALLFSFHFPEVRSLIFSWMQVSVDNTTPPSLEHFHEAFLPFVLKKDTWRNNYSLRTFVEHLIPAWLGTHPSHEALLAQANRCAHPVLIRHLTQHSPSLITAAHLKGSGLFMLDHRTSTNQADKSDHPWTNCDREAYIALLQKMPPSAAPSLARCKLPAYWTCIRLQDIPRYRGRKGEVVSLVRLQAAFRGKPLTERQKRHLLMWCFKTAVQTQVTDLAFTLNHIEQLWQALRPQNVTPRTLAYLQKRFVQLQEHVDTHPHEGSSKRNALRYLENWTRRLEGFHLEGALEPVHASSSGTRPRV